MAKLVLGFGNNRLRLMVVNNLNEVITLEEISINIDLSKDIAVLKNDKNTIYELSDIITSAIKTEGAEIDSAGVTIDSSQAFINNIPVDFKEDVKLIHSHLMWELSNYFPDEHQNFNIKYYKLDKKGLPQNVDEALLIAMDKNKTEFIKNIFSVLKFPLKIIDIDHFTSEKLIKYNYPADLAGSEVLLIGFRPHGMELSVICNEKLRHYEFINSFNIADTSIIRAFIKRMKVENDFSITKIFYYEDNILNRVTDMGAELNDIKLCIIDPFLKLKLSRQLLSGKNTNENFSRFSALCGLAVKLN